MEFSFSCKLHILAALSSLLFVLPVPVVVHGWGVDGHLTVCKIAQARLSETAAAAVKELLPADNDLGSLCSWADEVKRAGYGWSFPLHFVNTPFQVCNYDYTRIPKLSDLFPEQEGTKVNVDQLLQLGVADRSFKAFPVEFFVEVAGGETEVEVEEDLPSTLPEMSTDNLTEALLFLSHFIGDMHQPLHEGYVEDRGGNNITIYWYGKRSNLHRAWDDNIIDTARERFHNNDVKGLIEAIQTNITTEWASPVKEWENSCGNQIACPDIYASEGISTACAWAYTDIGGGAVPKEGTLDDAYFESRLPIVYQQLAKGGIRLASILNGIFVPLSNVN